MPTTVWRWYTKRYTCSAFSTFEQAQAWRAIQGAQSRVRCQVLESLFVFLIVALEGATQNHAVRNTGGDVAAGRCQPPKKCIDLGGD
jgi:hypothetical protein